MMAIRCKRLNHYCNINNTFIPVPSATDEQQPIVGSPMNKTSIETEEVMKQSRKKQEMILQELGHTRTHMPQSEKIASIG